jgi:hypothetical protein
VLTDTPKRGASEAWLDWFSETYAPAEAEARVANTLWADFIAGPQDGDGGAVESLMRTVSCSGYHSTFNHIVCVLIAFLCADSCG